MPEIISNQKAGYNYFEIIIDAPEIVKKARPGQFVMVKTADSSDPLLRRPLGVHKAQGKRMTLLYEIVGKGTKLLSQKKPGEKLDVLGPLGNGFSYPSTVIRQPSTILVAGGMGVAPLAFLAQKIIKQKPLVLLGAKTKNHILCEKEFKEFNCEVKVSTDDGSRGFKGTVTDLLKFLLTTNDQRPTTIYACGPRPMLKEINSISKKYNIPAQVSLEEHLACGFGACLGCIINTKSGYQRVCKEGPIFDAQEIIW